MKEINYWDRFLATGRVDDFLSYRKAAQDAQDSETLDGAGKDE